MITPELVEQLRCPWCGSGLKVERAEESGRGDLRRGVVRCDCCRYPLIDGILVLQQGATFPEHWRERAVAAVVRGDREAALDAALRASDLMRRGRAASLAARVLRRLSPHLAQRYGQRVSGGVVADEALSFEELALTLRPWDFAHYLVQRYANPSLLAAIPVMLLLGELRAPPGHAPAPPKVIDLGAGAGHASALLTRLVPGVEVITSDSDFISLCLARRLLGDGATIIGLDAEAPMPFPDGWLDGVFSLDAYHYMRSKVAVMRELRRAVRPDGMWVFPHLHNAMGSNPAPGSPLSPAGYRRCFAGIDARLYDEAAVLRRFVDEGVVDLSQPAADEDLARANSMGMIGRGIVQAGPVEKAGETLWRRHEGLAGAYIDQHRGLGLNPLYQIEPKANGKLTARRAWASERLHHECAGAEPYLPERVEVDAELMERVERGEVSDADAEAVRGLMRSFVLVPLPGRYRTAGRAAAPAQRPRTLR